MNWTSLKWKLPRGGERHWSRHFAFFPQRCEDRKTYWLCFVYVCRQYRWHSSEFGEYCLSPGFWETIEKHRNPPDHARRYLNLPEAA